MNQIYEPVRPSPNERDDLVELASLSDSIREVAGLDLAWIDAVGLAVAGLSPRWDPASRGLDGPPVADIARIIADGEGEVAVHAATADGLEYLALPAAREGLSHLLLGPFLTVPVDGALVGRIMARHLLPADARQDLANFLSALPLAGSNQARHLSRLFYPALVGRPGPPELIPFRAEGKPVEHAAPQAAPALDRASIEARYELERLLRHAVQSGDDSKLKGIVEKANKVGHLPDRFVGNPLRSAKNLAIVLNTILRVAASDGGVHPLKVHAISERFAIEIEKADTATGIEAMSAAMIPAYCALVREQERRARGSPLQSILDFIDFHLCEDLGLATLASRFGLTPAGLANRFRRCLGMTASDYINRRRVDEAAWYLEHSCLSVKELSAIVGYSDPGWFARRFREIKGLSPVEYRCRIRGAAVAP